MVDSQLLLNRGNIDFVYSCRLHNVRYKFIEICEQIINLKISAMCANERVENCCAAYALGVVS